MIVDEATVRLALERYADRLAQLDNVVGVGIAHLEEQEDVPAKESGKPPPEPCVAVYVSRKWPREKLAEGNVVPPRLQINDHVVRTRVIEVGTFTHQGDSHDASGFAKG